MDRIIKAFEFGKIKHEGQFRKASGHSYFSHPVAVSYIVAKYKSSKCLIELIIACYLHDVLEDTDCTAEEITANFGALVSSLVVELTNDPEHIKKVGKLEHQKEKLLKMSSWALVIKLADRLHNITDSPSTKMIHDTLELMYHLQTNRALTETHASMIKDIIEAAKSSPKYYERAY